MIESAVRLYGGGKANACKYGDILQIYISRQGAVYKGSLHNGQLSPLSLFGYCDEIIPFSGGHVERRGQYISIKND